MNHEPVLTKEVIHLLAPAKNENFIDATVGFGGHAAAILEKTSPRGLLFGIDRDLAAVEGAKKHLAKFGRRAELVKANFTQLGLLARNWPAESINGILFDLGTSNYQLTHPERGFSFATEASLDMRMDPESQKLTAADIVNKYSPRELTEILRSGEERFARQIVRQIVKARAKQPIRTTSELVEIIRLALPPPARFDRRLHFATHTFRALRMRVNNELENLGQVLPQTAQILSSGGRLVVISFHSLEDRIVKNFFRERDDLEIITVKPVTAQDEEIARNPRSRSAKLRAARKK